MFSIFDTAKHREEIEIIEKKNGVAYTGSITFKEAKYSIYKNVFGFEDFKNWNGVRFGFRGVPMALKC